MYIFQLGMTLFPWVEPITLSINTSHAYDSPCFSDHFDQHCSLIESFSSRLDCLSIYGISTVQRLASAHIGKIFVLHKRVCNISAYNFALRGGTSLFAFHKKAIVGTPKRPRKSSQISAELYHWKKSFQMVTHDSIKKQQHGYVTRFCGFRPLSASPMSLMAASMMKAHSKSSLSCIFLAYPTVFSTAIMYSRSANWLTVLGKPLAPF